MFTKTVISAALVATVSIAAAQAQNLSETLSQNTDYSFNGPTDNLGGGPSVDQNAEGILNENLLNSLGSGPATRTPEDVGIHAARTAACEEAGGRYVVGPVCYDREGNAINM